MPRLTDEQVKQRMAALDGWSLDGSEIRKSYSFADFRAAIHFVQQVADLAEEADHHPDILINYDRVTLSLSTHSEGGLTDKDMDLARRIDRLLE